MKHLPFRVDVVHFVIEDTLHNFYDLKDVKIYEKPLNKEKILKKIKKKI